MKMVMNKLALLIVLTCTSAASHAQIAAPDHALAYRGITPASTSQTIKSSFKDSACEPVLPLPDISCKASGIYASKIPADFTYAVWKKGEKWRIYQLEVALSNAGMQDEIVAAMRTKYGAEEATAPRTKTIMNVRFVEPATHTWHIGKNDSVVLSEADLLANKKLTITYWWGFTAAENAERTAWRSTDKASTNSNHQSTAPTSGKLDSSQM